VVVSRISRGMGVLDGVHVFQGEGEVFGVHPLVDQQSGYVRLAMALLDTAGINSEYSVAISAQFCFTCSLGGVTAMPRGLHARLCHAFLVFFAIFSLSEAQCTILLLF